jgi:hypothetical protein
MTGKELTRLTAALLLGAAVAFPAGMMLAGREAGGEPPRRPQAEVRDLFSPSVRSDPYFLDRQRHNVEALEAHCRRTGELCAESRAARRSFEELTDR